MFVYYAIIRACMNFLILHTHRTQYLLYPFSSFQGSENQKTLESFWHKEEEEVQRDSRLVKDCIRLIGKVF